MPEIRFTAGGVKGGKKKNFVIKIPAPVIIAALLLLILKLQNRKDEKNG